MLADCRLRRVSKPGNFLVAEAAKDQLADIAFGIGRFPLIELLDDGLPILVELVFGTPPPFRAFLLSPLEIGDQGKAVGALLLDFYRRQRGNNRSSDKQYERQRIDQEIEQPDVLAFGGPLERQQGSKPNQAEPDEPAPLPPNVLRILP